MLFVPIHSQLNCRNVQKRVELKKYSANSFNIGMYNFQYIISVQ